jgi:hypothetical protein
VNYLHVYGSYIRIDLYLWFIIEKMNSRTWFFRCISNHPVDDETCVAIVELLAYFYKRYHFFFDEWVRGLNADAQKRLEKAKRKPTPGEFKETLLKHDLFPKTVSLRTLMSFFEDQKFYGYMEDEKTRMMSVINKYCLPKHVEMMMIGMYEGYGPVAMGWCTPPDAIVRKFVSMVGVNPYHWPPELLRNPPLTQDVYIESITKDYKTLGYGVSQGELEDEKTKHRKAEQFRTEVLIPLDETDWSRSSISICEWLLARGFEIDDRENSIRRLKTMGCPIQ